MNKFGIEFLLKYFTMDRSIQITLCKDAKDTADVKCGYCDNVVSSDTTKIMIISNDNTTITAPQGINVKLGQSGVMCQTCFDNFVKELSKFTTNGEENAQRPL